MVKIIHAVTAGIYRWRALPTLGIIQEHFDIGSRLSPRKPPDSHPSTSLVFQPALYGLGRDRYSDQEYGNNQYSCQYTPV
jgi:hypothetical protein